MRRAWLGMLVLAMAGAGCNKESTPTTPSTTATPVSVNEEFAGTLSVNGAAAFPFTVSAAGAVTATLTSLGPDNLTASIGLSLGTWNGTSCTVSSINNDNAGQGTQILGQVTSSGSLCARIYDVGKIAEPIVYRVTVVHP